MAASRAKVGEILATPQLFRAVAGTRRATLGRFPYAIQGQQAGSLVPGFSHHRIDHQLFAVWSSGTFELYFYWYARKPPFNDEVRRLELLERLNAIEGVNLPREAIHRRPNIPLATFADEQRLRQLLATLDWMIEQITMDDSTRP